jgi:hypothetical protein
MSKTCGECRIYDHFHNLCVIGGDIEPTETAKDCFEPKTLTNGGKIIAGGIKSLVKFHLLGTCDTCIYYNKEHTSHNDICLCPKDKTCADGIEAWLNAPAESEWKDD